MDSENNLQACLSFFRERPVFDEILVQLREKYRSYGRCAGSAQICVESEEALADLEGFMRKNYHGKKKVRITARQFAAALQESRFSEFELEELLENYFDEPLLSKKEQQEAIKQSWQALIEESLDEAKSRTSECWLKELLTAVLEQDASNKSLAFIRKQTRPAEPGAEVRAFLNLGRRILDSLPAQPERYMAVFAAELTGDPHAFDRGRKEQAFLRILLDWMQPQENDRQMQPVIAEQKRYLRAGLLINDVSNYVMTLGLRAWKRNGEEHMGMKEFFAEREPVQLPLSDIARWSEVRCPNKRLYMVENPTVYAVLCAHWQGKQALACVGGQPRLSMYELLDRLTPDTNVWYAGDFDPEGLLIAEHLARYYNGPFHFWHMGVEDYHDSHPVKPINDARLQKLRRLSDPFLQRTAAAIREQAVAGYQENLLQRYVGDIAQ